MNHGEKRNALSKNLIDELIAALTRFQEQQAPVVVLQAAQGTKVWSAGHDVEEQPKSHHDPLGWADPLRRLIRAVEDFPAPIIAMAAHGLQQS